MAQVILFDFDGTLYDTVEGITKCVRHALRKRGLDAPLSELRCFAGPPLDEMFREKFCFAQDEAEQAVRDFRERYVPIGLYESRPFPGLRELLTELREAGKTLGVTTSKPQVLAEELLRREGMLELFDVICGAADEGEDGVKETADGDLALFPALAQVLDHDHAFLQLAVAKDQRRDRVLVVRRPHLRLHRAGAEVHVGAHPGGACLGD